MTSVLWRNLKFLYLWSNFRLLHISDFSTFVMWGNLKYLHMTDVDKFQMSPHLSCINIWNFSTWQIFFHTSHLGYLCTLTGRFNFNFNFNFKIFPEASFMSLKWSCAIQWLDGRGRALSRVHQPINSQILLSHHHMYDDVTKVPDIIQPARWER